MSNQYIPYSCQNISEEDIKAVERVLRSDFLTQGPEVKKFEQALASYTGAKHVVAVSSGTAALHLAAAALGIENNSLVWTTPITFVASANCARYLGAEVDFVDVEPSTGNICIDALRTKLEEAKKNNRLPDLLIPVHFSGRACNMTELESLAQKYSFKIVEDASHALGGKYSNQNYVGSSAATECTVFSFHAVKSIATGEGGAVMTSNKELAGLLRTLRTHGITRESSELIEKDKPAHYYEQQYLGFNYRISDIQAALGTSQLGRLDQFIERRRELAKRYDLALKNSPYLLPEIDESSAWHLYTIQVPGGEVARDKLFKTLRDNQIGANVHYRPVHLQPYYSFKKGSFPNSEKFAESILSIPLHPRLSEQQQDKVVEVLLSGIS